MPNFPSRRALFAFARVISASKDIYRCPKCIRIQQNDGRRPAIRRFGISAFRHSETSNLSNSKDEGQLEDSPLLDPQTGGTKEATGSNVNEMPTRFRRKAPLSDYAFNAELEQILIGLEIAEVNIAELEDTLMDIEPTSTPFAKGKGLKRDFPEWYLQRDVQEEQDSMERFDERNEAVIDYEQPDNIRDESQDDNTDIVPWYLREQESDTSLLPQIDIQQTQLEKYPDLPFNSPPLLQPLVSRLFYDHHLQNIVLLDLRNRDPPPVWGSNTIMILATVRSERQLGGVAEATSKWLKQTAGVTPRTDGLPKRESLVIKRRRLRRKSLRKPGYLIAAPKPTTWVSMYTGYQGLVLQLFTEEGRIEYDLEGLWGDTRVVDAGVADMKPRKVRPGGIEEDEPVETSSSSVSQKKTLLQRNMEKEQKKWDKMKDAKAAKRRWTRQEKEQAKQRRAVEAASGFWQTPSRGRPSKMHSYSGDRQQRRQFHTTGSRHYESVVREEAAPFEVPSPKREPEFALPAPWTKPYTRWKRTDLHPRPEKQVAWWGEPQNSLPRLSDTILPSSVYEQVLDALKGQPPFSPKDAVMDRIARTISLQGDRRIAEKLSNLCASNDPGGLLLLAHFGHLARFIKNSQSASETMSHLSTFSMHPFPEKGFEWAFEFFLRDMPVRQTSYHWRLAILYYLNLQMHDPKTYHLRTLCDILLMSVSQGMLVPVSTFHLILNHIALSSTEHRNPGELTSQQTFHKYVNYRLAELEYFCQFFNKQFGYDYRRDEEVYMAMYKACCLPYPTLAELVHDIDKPLTKHYAFPPVVVIVQEYQKHFPVSPELHILELLQHAHRGKWPSFVKRWGWVRAGGVGRDTYMWSLYWCLLARGQNEQAIRNALKDGYPEMMFEGDQLVLNKDIAIGLARCLEIVDPRGMEYHHERGVVKRMMEDFKVDRSSGDKALNDNEV